MSESGSLALDIAPDAEGKMVKPADLFYDKVEIGEPLEVDIDLNLELESESGDSNACDFSNKRFRKRAGFVFLALLAIAIAAIIVYSVLHRKFYLGGCRAYFRNETNSTDDILWHNDTRYLCY